MPACALSNPLVPLTLPWPDLWDDALADTTGNMLILWRVGRHDFTWVKCIYFQWRIQICAKLSRSTYQLKLWVCVFHMRLISRSGKTENSRLFFKNCKNFPSQSIAFYLHCFSATCRGENLFICLMDVWFANCVNFQFITFTHFFLLVVLLIR